jgi:hypothetical protein
MKRWLTLGAIISALLALLNATQAGAAQAPGSGTTVSAPGYWLLGADGGVFSFNAPFYGSGLPSGASPTDCPYEPGTSGPSISSNGCTAVAATPTGSGYWIADSSQLPAAFGSAPASQAGCTSLNGATGYWSGVASSSTGNGFLLVSSNGAVLGCGDATPLGGVTALHLVLPIVGIAATPDGKGYWLVANDGGVFAFGDAAFYGSMGGKHLNAPVMGIASTPDGKGYWLVAADGGVFAFGDAQFSGSMGGRPLVGPITGIATNPDGSGYWMVGDDGGVFAFGGAPFEGSMGSQHISAPIVGIASTPN